ncbi:GtrA-like protein [Peptococcaceae bacterium CEB3]|nr:GtrA-like protein [Peptococcaceae bacterium CEB3]
MQNSLRAPAKDLNRFSLARYKSLWRFLLVGCVNTGVDFLLFLLLIRTAGINYLLAQTVSYCFGVVNSFTMNKLWTFDNARQSMSTRLEFVQFVGLNVLSLGISLLGLKVLNDYLGVNIYLAKVAVTGITWSVRYIGYKYWVFA